MAGNAAEGSEWHTSTGWVGKAGREGSEGMGVNERSSERVSEEGSSLQAGSPPSRRQLARSRALSSFPSAILTSTGLRSLKSSCPCTGPLAGTAQCFGTSTHITTSTPTFSCPPKFWHSYKTDAQKNLLHRICTVYRIC
jgi:hypothetical protein